MVKPCARRVEGVVWEGGQVLGEGFGRKKREEIEDNTNCQSECIIIAKRLKKKKKTKKQLCLPGLSPHGWFPMFRFKRGRSKVGWQSCQQGQEK